MSFQHGYNNEREVNEKEGGKKKSRRKNETKKRQKERREEEENCIAGLVAPPRFHALLQE